MFDRILVPLDGGPRGEVALRIAERLGDVWGAPLDVLGLAETSGTLPSAEEAVGRQTADVRGRGRVSVRTAVASVSEEIVRAVDADPSTLVVMATSAKNRTAAFAESVADAVLRGAAGPVLLVGPHAELTEFWPDGPMLICTDGSEWSEAIVPHSAAFVDGAGLDPWFVSVVDPAEVPAAVGARSETNYTARLAADFRPLVDREVNFDVLHGPDPADRILDYAKSTGASLIAMATHGRTGIRRLAMGSVAMSVVHDARCPVLVARPAEGT
ncbi:MAG: universal stress protein [Actinomycetota bacterium]